VSRIHPNPKAGEKPPRGTRRRDPKVTLPLTVNGETQEVAFAPHKTLLEVLREDMGLVGTKHGCELGECGTCTVIVDGEPVLSCLLLGLECDGREITTVEGLSKAGTPHPLQAAFTDLVAAQCGYCTPGFLCASKALLDRDPAPARGTIVEALSGNLCRCTGYVKIFEAIERAAAQMRGEPVPELDDPATSPGTSPPAPVRGAAGAEDPNARP
jgi:aerobic-type carbon monoxide dehydrogenase small subunit (CoxS/CutS family)